MRLRRAIETLERALENPAMRRQQLPHRRIAVLRSGSQPKTFQLVEDVIVDVPASLPGHPSVIGQLDGCPVVVIKDSAGSKLPAAVQTNQHPAHGRKWWIYLSAETCRDKLCDDLVLTGHQLHYWIIVLIIRTLAESVNVTF